jgi:hypothetical protein
VDNTSEVVSPQVSESVPPIEVRLDWSDAAAVEPRHINQVVAQLGNPAPDGVPDGVYVAFGDVPPPVVVDDEDRRRLIERLQGSDIKVTVQGRFHMSRGLLDALIRVLQTTAGQYDTAVRLAEAKRQEQG